MSLTLWIAFLTLIGVSISPAMAAEAQRPNILFAFADDWGRLASAYAALDGAGTLSDCVQTPNFDRVAKEGILFRNAFVNAPSCTPCRSSILSGQYFWRTGRAAILQGAVWDSTIPAWPLLLKESGYHMGKSYKVWSPGTPADAPYGKQEFAYQKAGGRINQFSQNATKIVASGKTVAEAKDELLGEVRENFRQFLAAQKPNQPFCFWYGPTNVHRSWTAGSGKKLWAIDPDTLKGKVPPFLPDVAEVREDLADYLGEVAAFDAQLGVLFEELKKAKQYENTLIAISGDHGPPGFARGKCNLYDFGTRVPLAIAGPGVKGGRTVDDLVSLPDLAPTFLEAAGLKVPDVMTAKSLKNVLESSKSGSVEASRDAVYVGRERHVEMARAEYLPYPQRAIRTPEYLYIVNFHPERYPMGEHYNLAPTDKAPTEQQLKNTTFVTLPDEDSGPTKAWMVLNRDTSLGKPLFDGAYGKRPREELYDVKKDPYQMKNLAGDPAFAKTAKALEERLFAELKRSKDPRMIDNGKYFESPPLAGPLPDDVPHPKRK